MSIKGVSHVGQVTSTEALPCVFGIIKMSARSLFLMLVGRSFTFHSSSRVPWVVDDTLLYIFQPACIHDEDTATTEFVGNRFGNGLHRLVVACDHLGLHFTVRALQ